MSVLAFYLVKKHFTAANLGFALRNLARVYSVILSKRKCKTNYIFLRKTNTYICRVVF